MDIRRLVKTDLNLLVALQALLEERSVSKAADRLFISQSAMSKTLGRLRGTFEDPLFHRSPEGLVPTPIAESIVSPLKELLENTQQILDNQFEPMTYDGEFVVSIPDFFGITSIPPLVCKLAERAPNAHLITRPPARHQLDLLANGDVDFSIQVELQEYGNCFETFSVGTVTPSILARKGHPLEGSTPTIKELGQYRQIILDLPDFDDTELSNLNTPFMRAARTHEPVLRTSHMFAALSVIRNTDYLMPGPPIFNDGAFADDLIELPIPEELIIRYTMINHKRLANSQPHQFMKSLIIEVVEEFRAERGLIPLSELNNQAPL